MHIDNINLSENKLINTVTENKLTYYIHKGTTTPFKDDIFDKKLFSSSGYFKYILNEPKVKRITTSVYYYNDLCGYSLFYGNGLNMHENAEENNLCYSGIIVSHKMRNQGIGKKLIQLGKEGLKALNLLEGKILIAYNYPKYLIKYLKPYSTDTIPFSHFKL